MKRCRTGEAALPSCRDLTWPYNSCSESEANVYSEETRTKICANCGATNHIIIAYAGDEIANERESTECFACEKIVDREKCFAIFSAKTPEEALTQLKKLQNRV